MLVVYAGFLGTMGKIMDIWRLPFFTGGLLAGTYFSFIFIIFSLWWIVNSYSVFLLRDHFIIFYAPQGDAFQTETEVSHCIAFCF